MLLRRLVVLGALLALGCEGGERARSSAGGRDTAAVRTAAVAAPRDSLRVVQVVETRFRPEAWADTVRVWGIMRGRLAALNPGDGQVQTTAHAAWSVSAGPGVVSWRNEQGTWMMRGESAPRLLASAEPVAGSDGPPDVLWSPDGRRALLSWTAEWDLHHELWREDGSRTPVQTNLRGYMLDAAALWLDSARVLFTVVANGPRGGEPEYRESGWRGNLAVLELHRSLGTPTDTAADRFRLVTDVRDGEFLRPSRLVGGRVLLADGTLVDTANWTVTLNGLPAASFDWRALGEPEEPGEAPAISPDGRHIAVRVVREGRAVVVVARLE